MSDKLQIALEIKEKELNEYLNSINDSKLKQLLFEVKTLKDASVIVNYSVKDNQDKPEANGNLNAVESKQNAVEKPKTNIEIVDESPSEIKKPTLISLGFKLQESIIGILPEFEGREFSRPEIYNRLVEKFPKVDGILQNASVTSALSKLAEKEILRVTFEGHGSDPIRFMVKESAKGDLFSKGFA